MTYRENIHTCLGHFPDETELDPAVIEQKDCGDHIRQLVQYDVEEQAYDWLDRAL